MKRLLLVLATACVLPFFSGCIAVPAVAMANLMHKSGTMTITLEGKGDAIKAFRDAAIRTGGTVPIASGDFARAEFSTTDMKVEAQVIPGQRETVVLRGSSLSNVGRTYEMKDNIGETTEAVALGMQGFVIKQKDRARGV